MEASSPRQDETRKEEWERSAASWSSSCGGHPLVMADDAFSSPSMNSEGEQHANVQSGWTARIVEACVDAALECFSTGRLSFPTATWAAEKATPTKNAARVKVSGELRAAMREAISQLAGPPVNFQELRRRSRLRVTGDENVRIRDHVSSNVRRQVKHAGSRVRRYVKRPPVVKTVDKVLFTAGVVWVAATEYVLLCKPDSMGWWLVCSTVPLMAHRVVSFMRSGLRYFLFDFCYFVNAICFGCLAIGVGSSTKLFEIAFFLCNGPLIFAIVVWRNSFIFHSLDHVCSTILHALPPLWTYTLRWSIDDSTRAPMPVASAYAAALGTYTVWQVLYIVKTEWLDRDYIRNRPTEFTSLRWMVKDSRGALYRLCKSALVASKLMRKDEEFDEATWRTKFTFWGAQLMYTMLTLLPVKFMWESREVHATLLALMYLAAIYNGASYYIEVFSRRYNLKFDNVHSEGDSACETMAASRDNDDDTAREDAGSDSTTETNEHED